MERFMVETRRMKGAPECMRISGFMHRVNNPELTKRLNEHVPKTMKEMIISTTAFIRGEAAAAGKKKGRPREGMGSNRFTPLTRTPKEILAAKAGKFQPPPPMVTPLEKRSSNKFCNFQNDKGYSTNECVQLKKQIEELVRAGKLSHLIKEIKQGRDQPKVGKKEALAKDKSMAIYMIQSWHRMTRQKVTQSFERVREIAFPSLTNSNGTEGPLVIEAEIGRHMIHCMYVDGGSSMKVLYEHCFIRLRPKVKNQMVSATTTLTGFRGETIWPLGQLRLLVTIGDTDHSTRAWMNFMTVRSLSSYNGVTSSKDIPKEARVRYENFKVALHSNFPDQEVAIGGTLSAKGRTELCSLLKENLDIFVWHPSDMTGVPRSVAEHRLNIGRGIRPFDRRKWARPRNARRPSKRSWRMCVNFTDLNKSCPQDCYPLPKIDWKVESLYSYPFKCFLDAYKGYHQIQLAESDEEKTAFHTDQGVYCYTKMAFDLKNDGATYQRLVDKAFDSQIGRNIEVYIDDLVIKSHTEAEMLRDISETFRTLRKINMKLNPNECTFGAVEGVFLGYMISLEGIKQWPDKIEVLLQLPSPRTIKEVQSLNRKLASLNRFLSKSTEKSLLLFKTVKKCIKKSDFHWTSEADQAFKQLKQHLSEPPLLVAPKPKEELIVYLSASHEAISAVLMTERGTVHTPPRGCEGQLQKWSVMLGEHKITYRPRTSVKGQILADFLAEMPDESPLDASVVETPQEPWTLFMDGSSSLNNEPEHEALIAGPRIAAQMGVRNVHVSVDSKLVANQVLGAYVAKEENMIKYLEKVKSMVSGFANFSINQVPRSKNKKADALSKIALTSFAHLSKQVLVEILKEKSIQKKEVTTVVEEDGPTWITPIIEYLKEGTLPGDRKEAHKLRIKARQYELGKGMHAGPRSVVTKAIRLGYYWQTMHRDVRDMIRACNDCQIHRPMTRNPQQPLTPITALWPFYKCGIDIAGPFPEGPGKVKFYIVAMDYFTKWIEAKAVATITGNKVKKFMWDNIVCRFGLPRKIVSDKGKQFSDNPFKDWCDKLNITQRFASVKHPQSNGLVERANQSLGEGIKARLGEGHNNWIEELPYVLWAHRTMIKSSNGDTPFSLTYGTEAVIPAEIGMPTYCIAAVDAVHNDEELRLNLDLLEERCERAAIREAKAKLKMTKYYNARIRGVTFRPGDFVYRSNDASYAVEGGKLGPKWEGPYEVTEALGYGAYKLRSTDETVLPRTWNAANINKCYL
nr:reverse transcriptase domain-containing protein [Tanacetum cinerariifolium]GEY70323.1 reverse transcriptase domain-containing protein [Tanacetum cinerariifolium]